MVKNNPPHDLYFIREQAQDTLSTFTNYCESFIEEIIQ